MDRPGVEEEGSDEQATGFMVRADVRSPVLTRMVQAANSNDAPRGSSRGKREPCTREAGPCSPYSLSPFALGVYLS